MLEVVNITKKNNEPNNKSKGMIEEVQVEQEEKSEIKFNPLSEAIKFEIEEKLRGEINKDGEVKGLQVKGEGFITLLNPQRKSAIIQLSTTLNPKFNTCKINKKLFNEKKVIQAEVREFNY